MSPILELFATNFVQQIPYYTYANLLDVVEVMGTFLYPLALSLQLPIYVYIMVMEKEEKIRELMKSMGLRMRAYYLSNVLFDLIFYLAGAECIFFFLFFIFCFVLKFLQNLWVVSLNSVVCLCLLHTSSANLHQSTQANDF